jgi:hypothetical protein
MRPRIEQEFALLREHYSDVEHQEHGGEDWFRLPTYPFPVGWQLASAPVTSAPVVFRLGIAYPSGEPYGFYTPAGINFSGSAPTNPGSGANPPFTGSWQHFSWAPDGSWAPTADVRRGSNLLTWARSFGQRLREGA